MKLQDRLFKQLETSYYKAKKAEMEGLHNAIVSTIGEAQASPENTLLVLEILKSEILNDCIGKYFAQEQPK